MSEKKRFLLRLDSEVYDALERWAATELRSVNSEIEYLLREALAKAGRLSRSKGTSVDAQPKGEMSPSQGESE